MNYNIKFEYKGIGKQASQARQKAVQAQKSAERKSPSLPGKPNKQSEQRQVHQNKELVTTLQKLIDSNKRLESAIRKSGVGGGGGGGRTPGIPGGEGSGRALGGMGASIPVVGAALGAIGFAVHKINQVGNSYIELTGKQARTVGMGGFRGGQGMYLGSEVGAGMAEFAKKSGQFARGKIGSEQIGALKVGGAYGMSAEETLGMAGSFKRGGGDYLRTAQIGRASGITSEMPMFLQAMSGIMEEAIANGLDASELSKDMGKNLAELTKLTPGRSVEAASRMIQSGRAVAQQSARGQVGSVEGFYAREATKDMLMERLRDPEQVKAMVARGEISEAQASRMSGYKTFEDLQSGEGAAAAATMRRGVAQEAALSPGEMVARQYEKMVKQFGTGPEGMQKAMMFAQSQGMDVDPAAFRTKYQWGEQRLRGETPDFNTVEGQKLINQDYGYVDKSAAATGVKRQIEREKMVMQFGENFAKVSLELERSMMKIAKEAAPAVGKAMGGLESMIKSLSSGVEKLSKMLDKYDKKGMKGMFFD